MSGIAGMGQGNMRQSLSGLRRAADLEEAREIAGMQMKQAYKQQVVGGTMSGVGAGAMIGAASGPVGAVIGGLIGGVVGYGGSSLA